MAAIVGSGLADAADAASKLSAVEQAFANTSTIPGANFEATYYNGTPLEVFPGVSSPRLIAMIDSGMTLDFGIQANDAAMREVLKGLAMIASIEPATIADPAAYEQWVGAAIDSTANGLTQINAAETRLGGQQEMLESVIDRQKDRADLYANQLNLLEGVDPYEAANLVTRLSTQLEATYAITARVSQLTFLNFMR